MSQEVYISGHRNPDTDSIASAIAYAELKRKKGMENVVPIRLGDLNRETRFVLDYFNVKSPVYKDTMKPQLQDLEFDKAHSISPEVSLKQAWRIMQENHLNSLTVVDGDEKLVGIVSLSNVTKCYMEVRDDRIIGRAGTSLANIVEALSADILVEPEKRRDFSGKMAVFAMEPSRIKDKIVENDLVIAGNRVDAQEDAIHRKTSLLIITGGSKLPENLVKSGKNGIIVISHLMTVLWRRDCCL